MKINKKPPKFRIRASQLGKLMTPPKSKADKEEGNLSETAKSYLEQWLKEQLYGRRYQLKSKYLDKGNAVEDESIAFAGEYYGWDNPKNNKEQFKNEYMTGEPDVILKGKKLVADMKNSYTFETFPLLETVPNKDYVAQLKGYMILLGYKKAELVYALMNLPEDLIEREYGFNNPKGLEYDEFRKYYIYDDVKTELRLKKFDIELNDGYEEEVINKVKKAREFISSLLKNK